MKENISFFRILRALIKISSWRRILYLSVGTVACFISGVLVPCRGLIITFYYDAYISNEENGRESDASALLEWAYRFHYCGVVAVVASFIQIVMWELANEELVNYLRFTFFSQTLRMDASWHDSLAKENDLSTMLSEDVERIRSTLGSKVSHAVSTASSLIGAMLCCLYLNTYFFLVLIIGGFLILYSTVTLGRISARIAAQEQQKFREVSSIASEVLTSLRTVKSYNTESEEMSRFKAIVHSGKKLAMRKNTVLAALASIIGSFFSIIFASATALGAYFMQNCGLSPGFIIGANVAASLGIFSFVCTLSIIGDISDAITSCVNLFGMIGSSPLIDPYSEKGTRTEDLEGDIVFKNVSFSYPTRKNIPVLKRISFTIPNGKTVALVGPSGSGKSSVLSLILRFFDPDEGSISIGRNLVQEINLNDLRKRIGVVSQEPVLFDGTIEENIRYGYLNASHDEIIFAAEMANAHTFIKNLPDGYETVVGERGAMLSGGQKQRIAIARALIRRPCVLLLDEATSALDPHSEKVVQETLENVSSKRTTVIVAHRLSSIKNADLIYVMKDGQIVEKGTHRDLMERQGAYFTLHTQQNVHEALKQEMNELTVIPLPENGVRRFSFNRMSYSRRTSTMSGLSTSESASDKSLSESIWKRLRSKGSSWFMVSQLMKMSNKWFLSVAFVASVIHGFHMPAYILYFYFGTLQRIGPGFIPSSLYDLCVQSIYFAIAVTAVTFFMYFSASLTTENLIEKLRIEMFRVLLNKKMQFFDSETSSPTHMVNLIIQNPGQLGSMIGTKASTSLSCVVFTVIAVIASFVSMWQIALILSIFMVFNFLSNYWQVTWKYKVQSSRQSQEKLASKLASICFDNIKVVHYLSLQSFMLANYQERSVRSRRDKWKQILCLAFFYSIVTNISFFYAGLSTQYGYLWEGYSRTSLNFYMSISFLVQSTFNAMSGMILHLQDAGKAKPAVDESLNLVNYHEYDEPHIVHYPEIKGGIQFKSVRFAYPTKKTQPILKGFSLDVLPGQTVALIGPSGNGKSTILSLLERFYDPSSGTITIDGVDIQSINVGHLRNSMALVTQEPLLFNTTIRENLLYGVKSLNKDVSEDELIDCCQQANIYNFIDSLPERFDTDVGARGSRLSGGQKQRIAVARALLRDPKILLLDEATSALDPESEKEVQKALNAASKGRTTIMIAHRLTTVANADLIVVVDNGVVREKGSHSELLSLKGKYYEMLHESHK